MKKIAILFVILINSQLFAQQLDYNKEEIFRAMRDEMNRTMSELKLESLPKPYYLAYKLKLRYSVGLRSVLGSIVDSNSFNFANISVDLRIGDYKLDNSNFFDVGLGFFGSSDDEETFKGRPIPYELSYNTIRREFWLASDAAYKQNSEIYSKKLSVMQSRIQKDTIPDFIMVEPQKNYNIYTIPKFDTGKFTDLINNLSNTFNDYPEIASSSVSMEYLPEITFYINSEGMEYVDTDYYTGLEVAAFTQSDDGMPVSNFFTAFAKNPDEFPAIDSLKKASANVAKLLTQTKNSASLDEPYSGPVLFKGQAAAEALAQVFAPQLITLRQPMSEGGIQSDSRGALFQNKIGGRVLPEFISLKAIPTIKQFGATPLLGYFEIDDDGLKTADVDIVNKGYLKNLLSERIPTRRVKQSNAHKRGGAAMYSTLQLISDKSKSADDKKLIAKMMKLCKDRELPYGIIVTKILNQNIMFTTLYRTSNGLLQIPRGDGKLAVAEGYKIYPDGKMELIRGAEILNLSPSNFKDIIQTGKSNYALNLLAPSVVSSFISGGDQYVGASIITPDLLFEDAEVKSIEGSFPKPPTLENPITKISK